MARRNAEVLFRTNCRRHLARLEHLEAFRWQIRTLLGLVHRGHATPFGRDHDFGRMRTLDDYRRLVPLRTAAELQRFPVPPVSPLADAARIKAVTTALALAARERPRARLFDGTVLLLGDDLSLADDPRRVLPALVRPYANIRGKVTCLVGSADRLTRYLDVCRPDDRATPAALLYTPSPGVTRERLRSRLSPDVLVLELAIRPEAPVAVEDPRQGSLRLLADHGVFFEFVPAAERNGSAPPRLTLKEIDTGSDYELVVTAPGGWWACRTGAGVRFDRRNPALLQFVPLPANVPAVITPPLVGVPALAPSLRTSGTPVALPGNYVHIPL
jgi:hypothetical protein